MLCPGLFALFLKPAAAFLTQSELTGYIRGAEAFSELANKLYVTIRKFRRQVRGLPPPHGVEIERRAGGRRPQKGEAAKFAALGKRTKPHLCRRRGKADLFRGSASKPHRLIQQLRA